MRLNPTFFEKDTPREVLRCTFNIAASLSEVVPFIISTNIGSDRDVI